MSVTFVGGFTIRQKDFRRKALNPGRLLRTSRTISFALSVVRARMSFLRRNRTLTGINLAGLVSHRDSVDPEEKPLDPDGLIRRAYSVTSSSRADLYIVNVSF